MTRARSVRRWAVWVLFGALFWGPAAAFTALAQEVPQDAEIPDDWAAREALERAQSEDEAERRFVAIAQGLVRLGRSEETERFLRGHVEGSQVPRGTAVEWLARYYAGIGNYTAAYALLEKESARDVSCAADLAERVLHVVPVAPGERSEQRARAKCRDDPSCASYDAHLRYRVYARWDLGRSKEVGAAVVRFRVDADGSVRDLRVRGSAGSLDFFESLRVAFRRASPFAPPPPSRWAGRTLEIGFVAPEPKCVPIHRHLRVSGELMLQEGRAEAAVRELRRAVAAYRPSPRSRALRSDDDELPRAWCRLGAALRATGALRDAEIAYRTALPLWEEADGERVPWARCVDEFASFLEKRGRYHESIELRAEAERILELPEVGLPFLPRQMPRPFRGPPRLDPLPPEDRTPRAL